MATCLNITNKEGYFFRASKIVEKIAQGRKMIPWPVDGRFWIPKLDSNLREIWSFDWNVVHRPQMTNKSEAELIRSSDGGLHRILASVS